MAEARPVSELDGQFVSGLCLPDQVILIDAQRPDEIHDGRDRGLADTDRADTLGLNQAYARAEPFQHSGEARGRHPAGRPTAYDDNALDWIIRHLRNFR